MLIFKYYYYYNYYCFIYLFLNDEQLGCMALLSLLAKSVFRFALFRGACVTLESKTTRIEQ